MVVTSFRLYLSPIVSSFTLLLFSATCKTLRTWGRCDLRTVAGCDVVQVVGAGTGTGEPERGDHAGGGVALTGRDDHHVPPPTTFHPKILQG